MECSQSLESSPDPERRTQNRRDAVWRKRGGVNRANEEEELCAPISSVQSEKAEDDDDDDQGQKASNFTPMIGNRGRDDMRRYAMI